jgi:hypothetical protein
MVVDFFRDVKREMQKPEIAMISGLRPALADRIADADGNRADDR